MKVAMITSRRNRVFNKGGAVRAALKKTAAGEIKQRYIQEFKKRVADWSGQPDFVARATFTTESLSVYVFPSGKNAKKWEWTSRGTPAHIITVVRAKRLAFQTNYSARTQPVGKYAVGSGKSSGRWRFPVSVHHPGTKARLFEEDISRQLKEFTNSTVRKAVLEAYK